MPQDNSLPADVLWGSFVTHSFLPHGGEKRMRDKRTPKDVCGKANKITNNHRIPRFGVAILQYIP